MEHGEISYRVVRSVRKTISIMVEDDGSVIVRCPYGLSDERIRLFVESKVRWIRKHQALKATQPKLPKLTNEQIRTLAKNASEVIPGLVAHYAPLVGVNYGKITIRSQRSRWGSCSSAGNLSINCLLMLVPTEVMEYVVVHELCHRKEMNHSSRFWSEVERVIPDYKNRVAWLKENGSAIIARLG